jgi:hypothetical protein
MNIYIKYPIEVLWKAYMLNKNNDFRDKMKSRISYLMQTTNTRLLIALPSLIGLLIGLLWIFFGKIIYGFLPTLPNFIIVSIVLFMMGFSGIVIIIKKEVPGTFSSILGIPAILIGLAMTAFFWGLAFLGIFKILTRN